MSKGRRAKQAAGLPLPERDSPGHLDARILARARERAPRRRVPLRPVWATGLATACVVGVALLLSPPEPQRHLPQQAPAESRRDGSLREAPARAIAPMADVAAPGVARESSAPPRNNAALREEPEEAAAGAAEKDARQPAPAAEPLHPAARKLEAFYVEEALRSLGHCAQLLARGEDEQARVCYDTVRMLCRGCELPPTLEEALAQYPAAEATEGGTEREADTQGSRTE